MKKHYFLALILMAALFSAFSFGNIRGERPLGSGEDVKIVHKAHWENI